MKDIELFDPRGSERLLVDFLGWDAPKRVQVTPGTPGIKNKKQHHARSEKCREAVKNV